MFDKYINYNRIAEQIIKNHPDNVAALTSLKEQYQEHVELMEGVPAVQYDTISVQSGHEDDAQANAQIRKIELEKKIKELEEEDRLYSTAWEKLTDDEQKILNIFFQSGMMREDAIWELGSYFNRERAAIYRMKEKAVRHFKRLMFG